MYLQTCLVYLQICLGLPGWFRWSVCLQCGRPGFDPWVRKILWRRKWHPIPVLLPGKSHVQRSVAGYSPWGRKESDTTEWLHFHFHRHVQPLPQSILEHGDHKKVRHNLAIQQQQQHHLLWEMSIYIFAHFLDGVICPLIIDLWGFFIDCRFNFLYQILDLKILLSLFDDVFWSTKVLNLITCNLSIFPFVTHIFGVIPKNPLPNPRSWTFALMFSPKKFIVFVLYVFNPFELLFCTLCDRRIQCYSFACGYPFVPAPFIKNSSFPIDWSLHPCWKLFGQRAIELFLDSKFYSVGLYVCPCTTLLWLLFLGCCC